MSKSNGKTVEEWSLEIAESILSNAEAGAEPVLYVVAAAQIMGWKIEVTVDGDGDVTEITLITEDK